MWMIPVMNAALVLAVAVIMPLAFRSRWWPWLMASLGVIASLWLTSGANAAVLLLPWVGLLAARLIGSRSVFDVVGTGFGLVSASALIFSRLEWSLFGITEPIIKLTALHFSYAGVGTFALARRLMESRPEARVAKVTVALVAFAPVVVALGFIARSSLGQVGGAVLMTLGTWLLALLNLRGLGALTPGRRVLMVVSSLSPWVSMVLAVSWAANNYWPRVPALTVVDMVPTHGALNAFGFVLCALLALAPPQGVTNGSSTNRLREEPSSFHVASPAGAEADKGPT